MKILVLNGPNLNLLGVREQGIYGNRSFEDYLTELTQLFPDVELAYYQSNSEGDLVSKIHEVGFSWDGVVFNAGAYTHTSVALADAIAGVNVPVIEVHISNVASREAFRHISYIAPKCIGTIAGFGLDSYRLGLDAIIKYRNNQVENN